MAASLKRNPYVVSRIRWPAGARDRIEDTFAGRTGRKTPGRMDITEYADQGGILLGHPDDDLRLERSVLEATDDIRLKFGGRAVPGTDSTRIGDGYVSSLIDSLVRDGDEVTGTNSSVRGK